jgi:hypothetical protein
VSNLVLAPPPKETDFLDRSGRISYVWLAWLQALTGSLLTANVTTAIPVFGASGASHGVGFVPDPGATAGTTRYLREDGSWVTLGGGAASWGSITGTLASQADLSTALAGKQASLGYTPLNPVNALSEVSGVAVAARSNLGLGSAATQPATAFDASGAATAAVAAIPTFGASGASHSTGFVPDPGASAGTVKFLREDSTWATPAGGAVTTVFGRTGDVVALASDYPAFVASGASHAQGMVPDPGASAGSTKYLREDGTWAVAAQLSGTNTWSNAQTFSQTCTFNLALNAKMFAPVCRTVSTATDTASVNTDHTLILNGVTTETLPASPANGHEFYLVNIGGSAATISGNGHNIWSAGTSAATISLASNATAILIYDTANTLWRQIK